MYKELSEKLLRELLKNSKRSDRELAKVLGVSQPTVTRTRQRLEEEGVILDYTVVPDFGKMGFEVMAIGLVKMRADTISPESMAKAKEYASRIPNAIFSAAGEGMGMDGVVISLHKNYTDLHRGLAEFRATWKDYFEKIEFFVVALGEDQFKRLSLTYLKDVSP